MLKEMRRRLTTIAALRTVWRVMRRWLHPHHRALRVVERAHPGRLLQPSQYTAVERYPAIFDQVALYLSCFPAPEVLSYGCSSGEEVFSLRRRLLNARITGVDINPRNLAKAQRKLRTAPDPGLSFRQASDPADLGHAPSYDAVLCFAVVRHGDLSAAPPDCNSVFPFEKAEAFVTRLAALVRPGGFLALWHVHFRLSDMAISSAFEPVFDLADDVDANQPLYGPGGARILDKVCTTAIYRKRR